MNTTLEVSKMFSYPPPEQVIFSYVVNPEDEGQKELEDMYLSGESKELAAAGAANFKAMYVVKRIFRWSSGRNTVVFRRQR